MKRLHKWAMAATVVTAGLGVTAPALAEVSAADIAVIAQTCVAIDRGEVTEEDLDILDDEEYGALMSACGFAADGVVSEAEMVEFETYYVVFQEDVTSFESVIYESSIETEESYEESEETVVEEEYMEEEAMSEEEYMEEEYSEEESDLEEADAEMEEEYEEADADEFDDEYEEADEFEEDMDESAMDESEAEEG